MRSARAHACALIAVGVLLADVRAARADRTADAVQWGLVVAEATAVPVVLYVTSRKMDTLEQQALLWTPFLLGAGVAYLSDRWDWDPRIPRAIHGGGWTGATLYLAGGLLEGRGGDGFEAGPLAWSLGVVGALAGGYVGATELDEHTTQVAWMLGFLGGGAGALGAGLAALIAQTWSEKKVVQVVGWSSVVGLTLGLGIGYVLAFTDEKPVAAATGAALGGRSLTVEPARDGFVFTLSGTF